MAEDALSFTFGKTLTLFEETDNPVFAWREVGFRIRANEPLPAWVNEYLASCADRLEVAESTTRRRHFTKSGRKRSSSLAERRSSPCRFRIPCSPRPWRLIVGRGH